MLWDKPNLADGGAAGFAFPDPLQPVRPEMPHDWQGSLADAASPLMHEISGLNRLYLTVALAVFAYVMLRLIWLTLRYHVRFHPQPAVRPVHPLMQIAWVGIPAILLVLLSIASLKGLSAAASAPVPDITVEVIGRIGAWSYGYPNNGDFRYDSQLLDAKTAAQYHQPYILAADQPLVVPAGRVVEVQLTSADVVHSWSVPALGVRADAVPGRISRIWFRPMREGIYYGMCSEFCGARQGFMPVAVKVVSGTEFQAWLSWAYPRYGEAVPQAGSPFAPVSGGAVAPAGSVATPPAGPPAADPRNGAASTVPGNAVTHGL